MNDLSDSSKFQCDTEKQNRTEYPFLGYGAKELHPDFSLQDVLAFLDDVLPDENVLTEARLREFHHNGDQTETDKRCDFCGRSLNGVSYQDLEDGRSCCDRCSSSVVTCEDEIRELLQKSKESLEHAFGIRLPSIIDVHAVPACDLKAYIPGSLMQTFTPDQKLSGILSRSADRYVIYIEGGTPRLSMLQTILMQLVHIWQLENWNSDTVNALLRKYGGTHFSEMYRAFYTGMSVWASLTALLHIGETDFVRNQNVRFSQTDSSVSIGYQLFRATYPIERSYAESSSRTPFSPGLPVNLSALSQAL